MDDVILGGSVDVASDVELFRNEGIKIGLVLDDGKCELTTRQTATSENTKQSTRVDLDDSSLLGTLINTVHALDTVLEARNEDLRRACSRTPAHLTGS
jgi:hypothetical protein